MVISIAGHYQGVVCLMHHFMMNIRVYDYSVTEITSQNVREIMVALETDILSPLLKSQLECKEVGFFIKYILLTFNLR